MPHKDSLGWVCFVAAAQYSYQHRSAYQKMKLDIMLAGGGYKYETLSFTL